MPTPLADLTKLDNAAWHALTDRHARFAEAAGRARRYDPDVSVFAAVDAADDESWRDLAALVGPGGIAMLFRPEIEPAPDNWTDVMRGTGYQMVCETLNDVEAPRARRLTVRDVPRMVELVDIAKPGPFRPRTIELGAYWGVFENNRLVAMAGERLQLPGLTEISAVATHPDARGRGLAAGVTALVARNIVERGETPFLHFAAGNDGARRVYERLGFEVRRTVDVAVLRAPVTP